MHKMNTQNIVTPMDVSSVNIEVLGQLQWENIEPDSVDINTENWYIQEAYVAKSVMIDNSAYNMYFLVSSESKEIDPESKTRFPTSFRYWIVLRHVQGVLYISKTCYYADRWNDPCHKHSNYIELWREVRK